MQAIRNRDTAPERRLRSLLHGRGLRYRVAARPLADVRWTADLVFRRSRVAVFIDGCFWHGCPEHFKMPARNVDYWTAKFARNRRRDAEFDDLLAAAGWKVVRVWEHDDAVAVADHVEGLVRDRRLHVGS